MLLVAWRDSPLVESGIFPWPYISLIIYLILHFLDGFGWKNIFKSWCANLVIIHKARGCWILLIFLPYRWNQTWGVRSLFDLGDLSAKHFGIFHEKVNGCIFLFFMIQLFVVSVFFNFRERSSKVPGQRTRYSVQMCVSLAECSWPSYVTQLISLSSLVK